jgi:hypothetical protein
VTRRCYSEVAALPEVLRQRRCVDARYDIRHRLDAVLGHAVSLLVHTPNFLGQPPAAIQNVGGETYGKPRAGSAGDTATRVGIALVPAHLVPGLPSFPIAPAKSLKLLAVSVA